MSNLPVPARQQHPAGSDQGQQGPGQQGPGQQGPRERVEDVVGRLVGDRLGRAERATLLARLAGLLAGSARTAGVGAVTRGRWLSDVIVDVAPRVPVRDRATLLAQHPGRTQDEIADRLLATASRVTAGIGAAGGALSAVEWTAPPALLTTPVQLAAETVAVVAVELKLVAELHEVYGRGVAGAPSQRATAYLRSWAAQRGVDVLGGGGAASVLGVAARGQLRRRMLRRFGRNMSTLAPFLAGAAAGAETNRRATRALGEAVARDLRGAAGQR